MILRASASLRGRTNASLPRLAVALATLAAMFVLSHAGDSQAATTNCTENQQQGRLCLSIADTPDPVAYSSFDGNQTYLAYDVEVTNESRSSNLSHVGLAMQLPAETSFISSDTSAGTCTQADHIVRCAIGQLQTGSGVSIEVVVAAPATADPSPPDILIANTTTASFDERFNDQGGGKLDTATVIESTLVSAAAGQTFIPSGLSGRVSTDPDQDQYANATVQNASTDLLATIHVLDPDSFCSGDTVKIAKKSYVCRDGGFVDVSVVGADTGATYTNVQRPLVFHLRWDADLVSGKQTIRNFVVFYQSSDTSSIQAISQRCNGAATNLPCIRNVTKAADGSWSVELVKSSNGRMR
jgi:Domain of unknown function DUF11